MRVLADIDEADVGKVKDGMDTDCVVDAFPGDTFRGKVAQIRYSPNTVSGVVTYPAVVEVDNPDEKLRPGMTTTITVRTHAALGVPRIPNAALRYRPSPVAGANGKPATPAPEAPLGKGEGRVWVLTSDVPGQEKAEERTISIGVTDGINTAIVGASLPVGVKVVTDETDSSDKTKSARVL